MSGGWKLNDLASMTLENRRYAKVRARVNLAEQYRHRP